MNYHSLSIKKVLTELASSESGLSLAEAEKRNKKYGLNEMPAKRKMTRLALLAGQFKSPLVIILLMAGFLSISLKEWVDAGVILAAVFMNIIIGFVQENKANEAVRKLRSLVAHKTLVLRSGQEMLIDARLVTVGDIILIKSGNRISADARIIDAVDLQINESGLTGESMPAGKKTDIMPRGAALADRENMAYAGTMAVRGMGRAMVTAIGARTEIGQIARLVEETGEEATPLQKKLAVFARWLGLLFGFICAMIVVVGLIQGRELLEMIETGVAVGVASIPEGLSVAVTFILALGMQRILKKRALTRKLMAAETLGSITVICTDKTGTLTEGKMHVAHIVIGESEFEMDEKGWREDPQEAKAISLALRIAMMCNDAVVENPEAELSAWRIIGSPTEAALLSAAIQSGLRQEKLAASQPKIDELPFDSDKKYMLSLHRQGPDHYVLYEKGAMEKLLDKSIDFYHKGGIKKLDQAEKDLLIRNYEKMTAKGLRVIGLALREFKSPAEMKKGAVDWKQIDSHLTFVGYIAIKDPLRPEAAETISICRQAGIRPILITGDHPLTARAIAEEAGLKARAENILIGSDLEAVSDDELKKLVKKVDVYARVSPHHKLRIVNALKSRGEVVAMTGDGINDAPALKAADIGISLGTGTDIAKETADIVLLDDNFATIVSAIKQGRVIFQNIRKVVVFLLSDSLSEVVLIVASILLGLPLAILPLQILWVNIVKDGFPHFALAFEKGDGDVMLDKPFAKNEPLLNQEMKVIIFAVGFFRDLAIFSIFYYLLSQAADISYIRTIIFTIIGVDSLFYIFSLRNLRLPIWRLNPFDNPVLIAAALAGLFFMLLAVYFPPLQSVLSTVALGAGEWMLVILVSFMTMALLEAVKFIYTRRLGGAQ